MSVTKEQVFEFFDNMTVLDMSKFVKEFEERHGVTAAAPVAVVSAPAAGDAAAGEPAEEQTVFNVWIAASGANKLGVIKTLRELAPILGLKEAKDLVDAAPKEVMTAVNKKTADEAKEKLTAAGATVELK